MASKARREEILGTHRDRMIRDEGLKLRKKLVVLAKRSETERARAEFYSRNRLKIQRVRRAARVLCPDGPRLIT